MPKIILTSEFLRFSKFCQAFHFHINYYTVLFLYFIIFSSSSQMIKKFFNIIIFIFCLYGLFWLIQNLDIVSLYTSTVDLFKYEFLPEHLCRSIESLNNALK